MGDAPLDYQSPATPKRRRPLPVVRTTLILAGLVLAVVFGARPVADTVSAWPAKYHRSRCMKYTAPADQVVYDEDYSRSAALLQADPAHYRGYQGPSSGYAYNPSSSSDSVGRIAEPLAAWKGHQMRDDFPLFLHARRRPAGGDERLLMVFPVGQRWTAGAMDESVARGFNCYAEPAAGGGKIGQSFPRVGFARPDATSDAIRYRAGQPDPNDESHFTIEFDLGARHGVIDGWLRDDDSVDLQVRPGSGGIGVGNSR